MDGCVSTTRTALRITQKYKAMIKLKRVQFHTFLLLIIRARIDKPLRVCSVCLLWVSTKPFAYVISKKTIFILCIIWQYFCFHGMFYYFKVIFLFFNHNTVLFALKHVFYIFLNNFWMKNSENKFEIFWSR